MASIFVSYRRNDNAIGYAKQLADDLSRYFGENEVFRDQEIPPGVDFDDFIQGELVSCKALLVVIGRLWLSERGREGPTRLHDPDDWVRIEIRTALGRGIPVIPVLVGGGTIPTKDSLPEDVAGLVRKQAQELNERHWQQDVESIVAVLASIPRMPPARASVAASGVAVESSSRAEKAPASFAGALLALIWGSRWAKPVLFVVGALIGLAWIWDRLTDSQKEMLWCKMVVPIIRPIAIDPPDPIKVTKPGTFPITISGGRAPYQMRFAMPVEGLQVQQEAGGSPFADLLVMDRAANDKYALRIIDNCLERPLKVSVEVALEAEHEQPLAGDVSSLARRGHDVEVLPKGEGADLGALWSSGRPDAIGRDSQGEWSYGLYQMATYQLASFLRFLGENYPKLSEPLQRAGGEVGARQGATDFLQAWKSLAHDSAGEFARAQYEFITNKYYKPFAARLREQTGFDLSDRSLALQSVAWSVAVQHGERTPLFAKALKSLDEVAQQDDVKVIEAVYDERKNVDVWFSKSTDRVKQAVLKSLQREQDDALQMIKAASASSGKLLLVQAQQYPAFARWAQFDLPKVPLDLAVWQPFLEYSRLGVDTAKRALDWNSPPRLFVSDTGAAWALFDPQRPNTVVVSRELVEYFEANPDSSRVRLDLERVVLHELVHWALNAGGISETSETGEAFETSAYGTRTR